MQDEKTDIKPAQIAKPSLWEQAKRAVKGDSTNELVEQFTQEMTLVAEGLCEDQARLRRAVDGLIRQAEKEHADHAQDQEEVSRQIQEAEKASKARMADLERRLEALEKAAHAPRKKPRLLSGDTLGRVTLLAAIICGTWLIVTVLKLFV